MYAVLGKKTVTDGVLSPTICLVEEALNGRPLTPVTSDATELEAITPTTFWLALKIFVLHIYHAQRSSSIIGNSFDKHKLTQTSSWTESALSTCQR